MSFRIIIIVAIWAIIDLYAFQVIKTVIVGIPNPWHKIIYWGYWFIDIAIASLILYYSSTGKFFGSHSKGFSYIIGLMFISLGPKLVILPILLIEDTYRIFHTIVNFFISHTASNGHLMPGRRKFVSQIALGIAAVPFLGLIHGMLKGKYNFKVHRVTLAFKDLPDAFHNFTITQISDIHTGSFDNEAEVLKGIELANAQKSDILFFTGDLVNNVASEAEPWIPVFSKLHAPFGKYSILGNHDYADYVNWPSNEAKARNLDYLKEIQKKLGFRLLLNENIKIEKDGQCISLIGVENWGKRGFAKYGKLNDALKGVDDNSFKILLSHDPSHWEAQVLNHHQHIHLTLSGHTHGMQFGIEVPGFKWSPVQYFYPQWAGLYKSYEKYIYVNRGFGFIGYPGRAGIYPEITVIQLKKG